MFKKSLTITLSLFYFCATTALSYAAESNMWTDRRSAMQKTERTNAQELASLPSLFSLDLNNPDRILNSMPRIDHSLGAIPNISSLYKKTLPATASPYVDAIPLNRGIIKEIHGNPTGSKGTVVLLQDIHLNTEAQKNLSEILSSLNNKAKSLSEKPLVVGVEGAFGPFNFKRLRAFDNHDLMTALGNYFLENNKIAAPSFVGMTVDQLSIRFMGVDDLEHYKSNLEAYKKSLATKKGLQERLASAENSFQSTKRRELKPELKELDDKMAGNSAGTLTFGEHIHFLNTQASKLGLDIDNDAYVGDNSIQQFLTAFELEKTLNFSKVEQERTAVIEKVAKLLSKDELAQLARQGMAYRTGQISFGSYYKIIRSLLEEKGVSLRKAPAFEKYIRYVLLTEEINGDRLMEATRALEKNIIRALAKNPDQMRLMNQTRSYQLLHKLIEFGMTPDEWLEYKSLKSKDLIMKDAVLPEFEKFYEEADLRSKVIVRRLLGEMTSPENGNDVSALIVGGYHTPLLEKLLDEKGYAVVVVQPKIVKFDGGLGTEYLSIFKQEKTPLDKLFEGPKLFLAPYMLQAGTDAGASATNQVVAAGMAYSALTGSPVRLNDAGAEVETNSDKNTVTVKILSTGKKYLVQRWTDGMDVHDGDVRMSPDGTFPTVWRDASSLIPSFDQIRAAAMNFISGRISAFQAKNQTAPIGSSAVPNIDVLGQKFDQMFPDVEKTFEVTDDDMSATLLREQARELVMKGMLQLNDDGMYLASGVSVSNLLDTVLASADMEKLQVAQKTQEASNKVLQATVALGAIGAIVAFILPASTPLRLAIAILFAGLPLSTLMVLPHLPVQFFKAHSNWFMLRYSSLKFQLAYGGFNDFEIQTIRAVRAKKLSSVLQNLVPVIDMGVEEGRMTHQQMRAFQAQQAAMTQSALDISVLSFIESRPESDSAVEQLGFGWTSDHMPGSQLRIYMADPSAKTIDLLSLLNDVGPNDRVLLYAGNGISVADPRVTVMHYENSDMSSNGFTNAVNETGLTLAQLARVQIRIAKAAAGQKRTADFAMQVEKQLSEARILLDMKLLLPVSAAISIAIPIVAKDLLRMVEFQQHLRRLIELQA